MKICLDPGHGGKEDNRGIHEYSEKEFTLCICKGIQEYLKLYEADVMLTRESDSYVSLDERHIKANSWDADYFISIHTNANDNVKTHGIQCIHSINGGKGRDLAYAISDGLHEIGIAKHSVYNKESEYGNYDYYSVIRNTTMPAVIVEVAFHTNPVDEAFLLTDWGRQMVIKAISNVLIKHLELKERKPMHETEYSVIGKTHIIECDPQNVEVWFVANTLRDAQLNGINGGWFDINNPACLDTIWHVAIDDGKIIGNATVSSGSGLSYKPPRGTIYYTKDGKLDIVKTQYLMDGIVPIENIQWAISGGMLIPDYNPVNEGYSIDVTRECNHTGIGFDRDGKIFMFVKIHTWCDRCPLSRLVLTAENLGLVKAIFLDGGESSQLNYNGKGIATNRKIATAVVVKKEG